MQKKTEDEEEMWTAEDGLRQIDFEGDIKWNVNRMFNIQVNEKEWLQFR